MILKNWTWTTEFCDRILVAVQAIGIRERKFKTISGLRIRKKSNSLGLSA